MVHRADFHATSCIRRLAEAEIGMVEGAYRFPSHSSSLAIIALCLGSGGELKAAVVMVLVPPPFFYHPVSGFLERKFPQWPTCGLPRPKAAAATAPPGPRTHEAQGLGVGRRGELVDGSAMRGFFPTADRTAIQDLSSDRPWKFGRLF